MVYVVGIDGQCVDFCWYNVWVGRDWYSGFLDGVVVISLHMFFRPYIQCEYLRASTTLHRLIYIGVEMSVQTSKALVDLQAGN